MANMLTRAAKLTQEREKEAILAYRGYITPLQWYSIAALAVERLCRFPSIVIFKAVARSTGGDR